jgi:hypothetical protein
MKHGFNGNSLSHHHPCSVRGLVRRHTRLLGLSRWALAREFRKKPEASSFPLICPTRILDRDDALDLLRGWRAFGCGQQTLQVWVVNIAFKLQPLSLDRFPFERQQQCGAENV